ncbi:MAG: hypothetical protein MAG451_02210 [Anaerolineales bacterium]|nr:hypothetical protein [Anaerolineales bacterium]
MRDSLPAGLTKAITETLRADGDPSPIRSSRRVSGGDINEAARVETGQGAYFVKWNPKPLPNLFQVEARGLELLAEPNTVRVPRVYGYSERAEDAPAFIVLEWIEQGDADRSAVGETFGRQLSALHRKTNQEFGLDHDNYIGALPQPNTPMPSWIDFYRECRLGFQHQLARERGLMPPERDRRLRQLMDSLDRWIDDDDVEPSLLHGDLWGGNYLIDAQSRPVLIDPAVYYGHREIELAFTELFGGFPPSFYDAYDETYPLSPGHEERRPLYQLYHLLTHLNLFGETYGASVDRILRR